MRYKKLIILIPPLLIITTLVFVNIFYSQIVPSLYNKFINEDKSAIISYLISIRSLPIFQQELITYKNKYGAWVEERVFLVEAERNNKIAKLENVLSKNPKSRDVLYELSILYKEKGDLNKYYEYNKRAKEIDPDINN